MTHWIWLGIVLVCLFWYSTVVLYVALKGGRDIRGMLSRLSQQEPTAHEPR